MTTAAPVAVITGGASGIGLATAAALLSLGWRVAALDRDEAAIGRARATLAGHDGAVRFAAVDITDEAAVEAAATGAPRCRPSR